MTKQKLRATLSQLRTSRDAEIIAAASEPCKANDRLMLLVRRAWPTPQLCWRKKLSVSIRARRITPRSLVVSPFGERGQSLVMGAAGAEMASHERKGGHGHRFGPA